MSIQPVSYDCLRKYPFSLQERYSLGSYVASFLRSKNADYWKTIYSKLPEYAKSLDFLTENGYLMINLPNLLSTDLISELTSCSENCLSGDIIQGQRHLNDVIRLPSVQKLLKFQPLQDLASLYLQAPAFIKGAYAWWHYPSSDSPAPNSQLWHRDRDDFAELKLFFYATDVDNESGPHSFVPYSHNPKFFARVFRKEHMDDPVVTGSKHSFLSSQQLKSIMRADHPIKKYLYPAGACFLEDTRGFHRAFPPVSKPRLLFSLVWSLNPNP